MEDIRQISTGYFTMPPDSSLPGAKVVVVAYLIRHPDGLVLFDTGIGGEHAEEVEATYRPVRRPIREGLTAVGVQPEEVRMLANCHLHIDHSGGNRFFPDRPIFAQGLEYEAAHEPDYTVPEDVADFSGATFELHDGEADLLPGIRIVPTPGHVPGHQSLLVETREGRVLMAGQSFNSASEFGRAQFAWYLATTGQDADGPFPEWMHRIQEFDPALVLFAHDTVRWEAARAGG